jgi:hypothetical protein
MTWTCIGWTWAHPESKFGLGLKTPVPTLLEYEGEKAAVLEQFKAAHSWLQQITVHPAGTRLTLRHPGHGRFPMVVERENGTKEGS